MMIIYRILQCTWGLPQTLVGAIVYKKAFSKQLLVHEYGHMIQSLLFGPLYLILVGLPSVGWSFLPIFVKKRETDRISYFSGYPERWANWLGERFTDEKSIGEPV